MKSISVMNEYKKSFSYKEKDFLLHKFGTITSQVCEK